MLNNLFVICKSFIFFNQFRYIQTIFVWLANICHKNNFWNMPNITVIQSFLSISNCSNFFLGIFHKLIVWSSVFIVEFFFVKKLPREINNMKQISKVDMGNITFIVWMIIFRIFIVTLFKRCMPNPFKYKFALTNTEFTALTFELSHFS